MPQSNVCVYMRIQIQYATHLAKSPLFASTNMLLQQQKSTMLRYRVIGIRDMSYSCKLAGEELRLFARLSRTPVNIDSGIVPEVHALRFFRTRYRLP